MAEDFQICVDIDNVIARTDEVMRRVILEYTGGRVQLEYDHIEEFDYCLCPDQSGNRISKDEWKEIHELFSEPRYLLSVQPMDKAVEALTELSYNGRLHVATSRLPKARKTTVEWLERIGMPSHDLHFLRHGEKHTSLRSFDFAIEDDYNQAVGFAGVPGTESLLMRHPWNAAKKSVPQLVWVADWPAVSARIQRPRA